MIDAEKVIKGLETYRTRVNCKECPYAYDKRANDSYCEVVLHNDALETIKEQQQMYFALEHDWKMCRKLLKDQEEEIENLKQTCQSMMEGVCLLKEQEAKYGYWINPTSQDCHCSECGEQPVHEPGESVPLYDYCPYCGVKMEVKWNEID